MSEIKNINWNYPTPIWFGLNRSSEIVYALKNLNITKPLVVTDPQFSENESFKKIMKNLSDASIQFSVFTNLKGNPTGQNVVDGVKVFNSDLNDGVIAIGGGSALDAGKAIAFMSKQKESLWFFEDISDNWTQANLENMPKVLAIPTTAGTGSETGRASLIIDEETNAKKIIFHPSILPDLVILDPNLTVTLPAHLTAATGMDALAHCIEAFCSPIYHPMAHGIAVEGIRTIKNNLVIAFKEPQNIEARAKMLVSSPMGSTAFQKGLGAIHSLSHPINAVHDLHHGLTNAIFMPYVLKFNQSAIESKLKLLSNYLELKNTTFDGFIDWIIELRQELAIPHTLEELKVDFDFESLSEMALVDPSTSTNPINMNVSDMKQLYINAYEGKL
ncbi:iron-containing alcohol dehydrogenase [Pelagibacteraceae bacterium]|nr:iron-containing alcohol dehydrogenase [Pelagibacteraceae bacterium]